MTRDRLRWMVDGLDRDRGVPRTIPGRQQQTVRLCVACRQPPNRKAWARQWLRDNPAPCKIGDRGSDCRHAWCISCHLVRYLPPQTRCTDCGGELVEVTTAV